MALDSLRDHLKEATKLYEDAATKAEQCLKTPCEQDKNFRLLIQENTEEDKTMYCSAKKKRARAYKEEKKGSNNGECSRTAAKTKRARRFLMSLTSERLYKLCSDEMKTLVDTIGAHSPSPSERTFVEAAQQMSWMLGVSTSAWEEAAETMGLASTMLSILILDANRNHPYRPVRNVGGALRAFTRKHGAGELDLVGSLVALDRHLESNRPVCPL